MTTLNSKKDLLALLNNEHFIDHLATQNIDEFDRKRHELGKISGGYYEYPWDEENSGIELFRTPKRGGNYGGDPWGTWLTVSKLFGDHELPYRVTAKDYAPHGTEMDLDEHVGDFKTIGEALDQAFFIHEHGNINLHVLNEDEENGLYVKGDNEVTTSEDAPVQLSQVALEANRLASALLAAHRLHQQAMENEAELNRQMLKKAWSVPMTVDEAKPIIADIVTRLKPLIDGEPYSETMLTAATCINTQLFGNTGKLLSCYCDDLTHHATDMIGTVFVAVEREPGVFSFISPDGGMFDDIESAKSSVVAKLHEQYAEERVGENPLWLEDALWEVHLDEVSLNLADPVKIPDYDEEQEPLIDHKIEKVVVSAALDFRHALVDKMEFSMKVASRKERSSELAL